jgi:hypothetical protein
MEEDVTGRWLKLHDMELYSTNSTMVIKVRIRRKGVMTCIGETAKVQKTVVIKPEKRPLVRSRCRWEDNITINLKETGTRYV